MLTYFLIIAYVIEINNYFVLNFSGILANKYNCVEYKLFKIKIYIYIYYVLTLN